MSRPVEQKNLTVTSFPSHLNSSRPIGDQIHLSSPKRGGGRLALILTVGSLSLSLPGCLRNTQPPPPPPPFNTPHWSSSFSPDLFKIPHPSQWTCRPHRDNLEHRELRKLIPRKRMPVFWVSPFQKRAHNNLSSPFHRCLDDFGFDIYSKSPRWGLKIGHFTNTKIFGRKWNELCYFTYF